MTAKDGGQDSGMDVEIRRLKAENAALQKSLTSKFLPTTMKELKIIKFCEFVVDDDNFVFVADRL